jgi:hypothetical protein
MNRFRFVTQQRQGKWYSTVELAQRFAATIGAGFLDARSGRFVAYPGTRLEQLRESGSIAEVVLPETRGESPQLIVSDRVA